MNLEMILLISSLLSIGTLAFALLFAIGVIWRVEMELDISYKFFGWAIFFLMISLLSNLVPEKNGALWGIVSSITMLFSSVGFFVGVYLMRDIIRRIDGEKKRNS